MDYKKGSQLMHIENYNNRGNENKPKPKPPKKKKLTFRDYKKNTLKSLNEVYSIIMLKIIFDILYTKKIVLISITICILLIISFTFEYVINKMHSIILPRIEQSLKASIDLKILQNIIQYK